MNDIFCLNFFSKKVCFLSRRASHLNFFPKKVCFTKKVYIKKLIPKYDNIYVD